MKADEREFGPELHEFHLRLMAPAQGTFSPVTFLMTSSFQTHDFTSVSTAVAKGLLKQASEMLPAMFAESKDKELFVFEHSIPAHEKRHFVDFVSTPFGIRMFGIYWAVCGEFLRLLSSLAESHQQVTIPLRTWAKSRDCPDGVRHFLRTYEFRENEVRRLISFGEPVQVPSTAVPFRYKAVLTRLEVDDELWPYIGYSSGEEYHFYPINGRAILEGISWTVQSASMAGVDNTLAVRWWKRVAEDRRLWMYWVLPRYFEQFIGLDPDRSLKALEWSLMTPLGLRGSGGPEHDPHELSPSWRLYWFAKHLSEHRTARSNITRAAERFAQTRGWKTMTDNIKEAKQHLELMSSQATLHPNDPLLSVMHEYLGFARQSLDVRGQAPLLGFDYMKKLPSLPPMTRRILPDGSVQMRMKQQESESDEIAAWSWIMFAVLSSAISDCVEADHVVCPFAVETQSVHFPGSKDCTCRLNIGECYVSTTMKRVGASFR
jgi:hypothetical protein